MAKLPVKFFHSTMQGAPQITAANYGEVVAMLDCCLVNGFNLKSVGGITSDAGIMTVSVPSGHLYQIDSVVEVAGADQPEYNGEFRVLTVTANSLTAAITGTPVSPATGATLTIKTASLGWSIAFTGTNKRVYRNNDITSNRPYLRVDDSLAPANNNAYAKKAKVTMAENMIDVDTFVGARAPYSPTQPGINENTSGSGAGVVDGWYKWYYGRYQYSSTRYDVDGYSIFNRSWVVVGDTRGFYFFTEQGDGNWPGRGGYCFTDFLSYRPGDTYNTLLCATDWYQAANTNYGNTPPDVQNYFNRTHEYTGKVLMRDHTLAGLPVRAAFTSLMMDNTTGVSGYSGVFPWPNPPDYSLMLHPIYLMQENSKGIRGKMPGMQWVLNNQPLVDKDIVKNVVGAAGKSFLIVCTGYSGSGNVSRFAFDITGPWW